ncbi:hypothetical protein GQ457_05G016330 [Hibiscus cannabinus]
MDEHSKVEIQGENDENVEVDEAQKPLTAYFNFYISECKKRGGKKKITNAVRKELGRKWGKMSEEEKKPYFDMSLEQKQAYMDMKAQGKVKEEVKKEVWSRCSLKKLSVLFKEMQRLKKDGVVSEIGFGPLLGLKSRAIHREICRDLVQSFDVESSTMEYHGHKISIMVEDVEAVLGLKNEGVDVGKVIRKMNAKELGLKYKINTKTTYNEMHEEIVSGVFEGDELKARVLLYIVGVFLCPNANIVPSLEHLKLLCSVELKGKLNWCKWAHERLIDGVSKFKFRGGNAYITGCIAILEVRLFDYWSGIPSRAFAAADRIGRIHAWKNKDVRRLVLRIKGERPAKKMNVMESDDTSAEGTNDAKMKGCTEVIMDAFEKVFSHLSEMKVCLETGVDRQNKIEETLEILKDESKHIVDQVAGLSANMMYMKKALRAIDAKYGIGLEEEDSMGGKTNVHESDPKGEDEVFGKDVIHLKDEQADEGKDAPVKVLTYVEITDGVGASARSTCDYIWNTPLSESKVIVNFGHMYLSVGDADTLRPGAWVNSMVIDAVGWTIIVEDIRSECKSRRGYLPCALIDQIVRDNLTARQIADYWRLSFKHYGKIGEWKKIFIPINDSGSHWYMCALDMEHGEANVLDSLPTTRGNAARVAVVKKLIKKLGECFLDENFVQIFGRPQSSVTELRVVVPKVKHQSNGDDCGMFCIHWMQRWGRKQLKDVSVGDWDRMFLLYDLITHDRNEERRKISTAVNAHVVEVNSRPFISRTSIRRPYS